MFTDHNVKVYLVGGAVRDKLLGIKSNDRDYVVVGATTELMESLGFKQVGADFPVYLHPETKEEYALARQERKTGKGHKGFETRFSPDITIEEDLARRDLTINAIAQDVKTGEIIDPFNGIKDIQNQILRATTKAFEEDPLRILRLFRFKAKLGDNWVISNETQYKVHKNKDKIKELSPERIWLEFEKALKTKHPDIFIAGMEEIGLLPELTSMRHLPAGPIQHHPEGDAFTHTLLCIKASADNGLPPEVVFSLLCHDLGKADCWEKRGNLHGHEEAGIPIVENLCERLKVPNKYKKLSLLVTKFHGRIHGVLEMAPKKVYDLIHNLGGDKHREQFVNILNAANMDAWGRGPTRYGIHYLPGHYLQEMAFALEFNNREIKLYSIEVAQKHKGTPELIAELIRNKKIEVIRNATDDWVTKFRNGEIKE